MNSRPFQPQMFSKLGEPASELGGSNGVSVSFEQTVRLLLTNVPTKFQDEIAKVAHHLLHRAPDCKSSSFWLFSLLFYYYCTIAMWAGYGNPSCLLVAPVLVFVHSFLHFLRESMRASG